jgi:hypothetical protein
MEFSDLCIKCNHREDEHPILVIMNLSELPRFVATYEAEENFFRVQFDDEIIFEDFIFCKTFIQSAHI